MSERLSPGRQELVEGCVRLVYYLAYKRRRQGAREPLDELVSAGFLGLTKAGVGYDPRIGKFSSYAAVAIERSMRMHEKKMRAFLPLPAYASVGPEAVADDAPTGAAEAACRDGAAWADEELSRLGDRDADMVRRHVVEGETLDAVGARYGMTKQGAFRVVKEALESMRRRLEPRRGGG